MKRVENKLSNFLQSRTGTLLMGFIALAAAIAGHGGADSALFSGSGGFAYSCVTGWLTDGNSCFIAGLLLTAVTIVAMWDLNRTFNLLRDSSPLFLGVFAIMQCASPAIIGRLWPQVVLTVVVLGVTATFYSVYMRPRQTRRIFMAFCIMSAGALFDYVYMAYAAIFLLAFHQMRCSSARMYLAAFMGLVTPFWIAAGLGLLDHGLHWPQRQNIFNTPDKTALVMMLITVGVTVIIAILVCFTNMVKIYSYNAHSRALSGLLAMLTLFTALASLIDIANAPEYLPTLNCLAAFQVGLFFRITEKRRGYLYLLSVLAIYIILFFCNLWL